MSIGDIEKQLYVGENEEDRDQVDDTRDTGRSDRENDGLGNFAGWVGNLFTHGGDHAVTSQRVSSL